MSTAKPVKQRRSRNTRAGQRESVADLLQMHKRVARSSAAKLLRTPTSSLVIVFVVAVSLLLPALLFSLNSNLDTLLSKFQGAAQITLYLHDDVPETDGIEVSDSLLTMDGIHDVYYVSPAQALDEFGAASGLESVLQEMARNPLPGAIVVTPTDVSPAQVEALAAQLRSIEEVSIVQVDSLWLQRLAAISSLVRSLGRILSLIVILGLFFVVGNTVKLAVEKGRDEIRVIKLVGGSDMFAARPFLYCGLFYGVAGGILASLLQVIVLFSLSSSIEELMQLYESDFQLQGFGLLNFLVLVLTGAAVGWGAALLSSLRHIRSIDP